MACHASFEMLAPQEFSDGRSKSSESRWAHSATLFGLAAGVLILTGAILEFVGLGYLQIHVPGPWPASLLASAAMNAAALCARLSPWSNLAPLALIAAGFCAVLLATTERRAA